MEVGDAEEFTAALGNVFQGGARLIAHAHRQGVPAAMGLTTREWVQTHLGGYMRLAIEERRELVAELAAEDDLSQRDIAAILGVDHKTVGNDLRARGENSPDAPASARAEALDNSLRGENSPDAAPAGEQAEQQEDPDVPDPLGTGDRWRLRHMVARGLNQFSQNVLVLDPWIAADACDGEQAETVIRFRREAQGWLDAFEQATERGLRAVK